jgi:uncharacterized membrane protein YdjX (TVP38/TMEM64 family)
MPAPATVPETADPAGAHRRRIRIIVAVASILVSAGLIAVVPELRHSVSLAVGGHFGDLRKYIRGLGPGGLVLLLALMLIHAIIFYPSEIVTATAGYVYGFIPGLGFAIGGWLLSGLLAFVLGRVLGRPLLRAVLGRRFTSLEHAMERGGTTVLLVGRLIPIVPFSILGYAAGAARVQVWRFTWTTVVGFLPLTAAVAYLGSRAQTLSLSDPIIWIVALLIVALLASSRFVTLGRA